MKQGYHKYFEKTKWINIKNEREFKKLLKRCLELGVKIEYEYLYTYVPSHIYVLVKDGSAVCLCRRPKHCLPLIKNYNHEFDRFNEFVDMKDFLLPQRGEEVEAKNYTDEDWGNRYYEFDMLDARGKYWVKTPMSSASSKVFDQVRNRQASKELGALDWVDRQLTRLLIKFKKAIQ